ncbi:JNK-interacting protein 1-like isoform X2 [Ornithodoros turicata]
MNMRPACSPTQLHEEAYSRSPVSDETLESVNRMCEMLKELSSLPKSEKRRRKLPAIPSGRKPLSKLSQNGGSLADELRGLEHLPPEARKDGRAKLIHQVSDRLYLEIDTSGTQPKSCLRLYEKGAGSSGTGSCAEEDSSPEDSRYRLCLDTGADSGNSTAHSPDGAKSVSPTANGSPSCVSTPSSTTTSGGSQLQLHDATHRGLYRFVPRHPDEIEVDIGDPIYVSKEADDSWCEGVNLRTGGTGIFPSAYVTDVDYTDFGSDGQQVRKERFMLDFLGSVEVECHKGNPVFCQAVRKVVKASSAEVGVHGPQPCILEVTDQGLRMVDRRTPAPNHVPTHDYFFNLKNVTFCGYHPADHKYFGFITKHPLRQRFACHVFRADHSTRDVAECVGRAFHRFYQKFIEAAYPTEDLYIE